MTHWRAWILSAAVAVLPAAAMSAGISEGIEYKKIEKPQPVAAKGKVEVVEMFWYGCPHCYQFEPEINAWKAKLGPNVVFQRIPAVFNPKWELHARMYYAAEQLGVLEKMHPALFEAIHKDERKLDDADAIAEFFGEKGIQRADFDKAFKSFAVASKVNQARSLSQLYGIDGVPNLIVQGKYRTGAREAGSYKEMLNVVDQLVVMESKTGG